MDTVPEFDPSQSYDPVNTPPPEFDPSQPYQAVNNTPPAFDPSQSYQAANAAPPFDPSQPFEAANQPDTSPGGAFARQAIKQAPPAAAGWVGGVAGAEAGAAGGAALGSVVPGVGNVIGGVVGGIGGALVGAGGAGWLASKGEDWVLDKLGLRDNGGMLSQQQEQADVEQHPYASTAGSLADTLIGGAAGGATRGVRAVGAAIMGGTDAGQQYAETGEIDPIKAGMAAVAGAAAPNPRGWVNKATAPVNRFFTQTASRSATSNAQGTATEQAPPPNHDGEGATVKVVRSDDRYPKDADIAARQGVQTVASEPGVNTDAIHPDLVAALGGEDEDAITQVHSVGDSAPGNPPAPANNAAQQPSQSAREPNPESVPPIKTGFEDLPQAQKAAPTAVDATDPELAHKIGSLAIQGHNASAISDALNMPTPNVRKVRGALGIDPNAVDTVQAAMQAAVERPIVEHPMPSIANSIKGGPVVVDPLVPPEFRPFLAVHETVEEALESAGYKTAHKIATIAERTAAENAGVDWKKYQEWFSTHGKQIEKEPIDKPSLDRTFGPDVQFHVDPEAADGHYTSGLGPDAGTDAPEATATVTIPQRGGQPGVEAKTPKVVTDTIKQLRDAGMHKAADALEGLPMKDRAAKAAQLAAMQRNVTGEAEAPKTARVPSKGYKTESGVTAANKKDQARKEGALAATKSAFAKFGPGDNPSVIPTSTNDKAKLIDRLKQAVDHANEQNGGQDPIKGYRPNVKPPEWQWLKGAQKVIAKPTPKNIGEFITNENLLKGGGAKDVQDTTRIKADSELRPGTPDIETPNEEGNQAPRPTFENPYVHQEGKDNELFEQQQKLVDFVNDLPPKDYDTLAEQHDMSAEMDEPAEPGELLQTFKQTLAEATGRRPGVIERVPAEDVEGIPQPVKNRADLDRFAPTKEGGKASEGRVLTGEEKAKAIKAMNIPAAARNVDERIQSEEQAVTRQPMRRGSMPKKLAEATSKIKDKLGITQASGTPVKGTWDTAMENMSNLLKDASGKVGFKPLSWMQKRLVDAFSQHAVPAVKEYVDSLGDLFNEHRLKGVSRDSELFANANIAPKLTADEWKQIARAHDSRTVGSLPQNLQDVHANNIKPLMKMYYDNYNWLRKNTDLNLPRPYDDGTVQFQPLLRVGKQMFDREKEDDPLTQLRTLSDYAGPLQERDYFTLDNGKGQRIVFKAGDGEITVFRNGKATKAATVDFDGNPGDRITLKLGKGQADTYSVDHATAPEIMANVRDENGSPLQYHESPLVAWTSAVRGVGQVRDNMLLLQKVMNSKPFLENATNKAGAPDDWIGTKLPQLEGWKMDPRIAEAMDDFAHPGFDDIHLQSMRNVSTALIKTMYTFGPFVHALNEADLWAVSRGFDWLNPLGYKSLIKNGYKAIKSVNLQDDFQRQMRAVGANSMLASTLTRDFIPAMAEKAGLEISRDAPRWDPIAKNFGISSADLGRSVYKESSKIMWKLSDILLTHKVLENMDLHDMSLTDAVNDAHKFISDYRIGPRVAGSRFLAKALQDPAVSLFGRYHMGLWNSYGNMTRNLVKGDRDERIQAAGQLMAAGVMAYLIYPALDSAAQYITGNDDASFARRGFTTIPNSISEMAQGKRDYTKTMGDVFTPSLPLNAGMQALHNTDWKGQPIINKQKLDTPSHVLDAASQGANWAADTLVPPYETLDTATHEAGWDSGTVAKKFATSMVGISDPTDKARKYLHKQQTYNAQDLKKQAKTAGPIQRVTKYLTGEQ